VVIPSPTIQEGIHATYNCSTRGSSSVAGIILGMTVTLYDRDLRIVQTTRLIQPP
jgi:hypothetical protein